jgi:cell wall-associated NlpC family hydrolase
MGEHIVAAARARLGVRYQHQGRVNGVAFDCAGLPVDIAREMGIAVHDVMGYGRLPVPAEMRAALDASLDRVQGGRDAMQVGDVAWIRFEREPQHLAIVGDYPHGGFSLIHAYNGAGIKKVVEHRLDDSWMARIVAVWRYRELAP